MHRRAYLALAAATVGSGCLGAPSGDGDAPRRIVERSLRDRGRCEGEPESATVAVEAPAVEIRGCVTGPNGCAVASLGSVRLDDGALTVVVTTRSEGGSDVACTQALVSRAYEATVTLDAGRPSAVEVVHDAADGRRTVARL
jgi:hypothetical protein